MPEIFPMSNYFQAAKDVSSVGIVPAVALSAGPNVFGIQTFFKKLRSVYIWTIILYPISSLGGKMWKR